MPARTYPGTKATFSHDYWFVDILQVEAVNDYGFLLLFNVSDDGETAMMVSWMIRPTNWRPHRDDMG